MTLSCPRCHTAFVGRRRRVQTTAIDAIGGKLMKHFAAALGERSIRVNAVAPGIISTDMSSFTKTEAGRGYALGIHAIKRVAIPDEIGGGSTL